MTGESLPWEVLDRVVTEAKQQWGVRLFVFSGGEPLCYRSQGRDLLDIVEKNKDCLFLMFTNGTLLGEETAERLARLGNLTPALSVEGLEAQTDERRGEGTQRRVLEAMQRLRVAGVPFGISMTVTQANCGHMLADDLLDLYFDREGAFYGFVFQYMPIGRTPNLDWMPAPAQRIPFWERSWQVVRERRLFLLDFLNHGPLVEGCIAAGRERGYLHIDWRGDVMPCVFLPYAAANLHEVYSRGGTLDDVWQTPFLQAIRTWQSGQGYGCSRPSAESNWMLPCPLRDHFGDLRDLVEAMAPQPQAGVAPEGLQRGGVLRVDERPRQGAGAVGEAGVGERVSSIGRGCVRPRSTGRRRRGHPDARRQRLPADRRPGRQAGHHRLPGIAERAGQGTRHRQARRDHLRLGTPPAPTASAGPRSPSTIRRPPARRRSTRPWPTPARAPKRWRRPPARASERC